MATSGVTDTAETVAEVIGDALGLIHVREAGETPEAEQTSLALRKLRRMLRTWAVDTSGLWLRGNQTSALAADTAAYTLPARLLSVDDAFVRDASGYDQPLRLMDREEYNRLPDKDASGEPFAVWVDRTDTSSIATVYPVPAAVGDTLYIVGKRAIEDVTALSETMEVPPEWSECIVYNLAVKLMPDFPGMPQAEKQDVQFEAERLLQLMMGHDRGHSVKFRVRTR